MTTMLQHLRETAGLGQRELAARAGVAQETVSQLETGKSTRPRLDTLTKLRDALELGDMRPEDLLEPSPLSADPNLAAAATEMITLLKVLPGYRRGSDRQPAFWTRLSRHLGYRDLYPATHLTAHLDAAIGEHRGTAATELAGYTLMFFDPADDAAIAILAEETSIGPETVAARYWCRDVTEAAWTLHRAAMTSYPQQVGELWEEAGETTDPKRLRELCGSVYDIVRGRAYPRASAEDQIAALRTDPSGEEVHYAIAKAAASPDVQRAAVDVPTAWPGLAGNPGLGHAIAGQLLDAMLDARSTHADLAGRGVFTLAERADLPRPLLERISAAVDRPDQLDADDVWTSAVALAVRSTLDDLDAGQADDEDDQSGTRPHLRVVADDEPIAWWRRLLRR